MSNVMIACAGLWLGAVGGIIGGLIHRPTLQPPAPAPAYNDNDPHLAGDTRRGPGGILWAADVATPTNAEGDTAALARAGNTIGATYLWQMRTGDSFRAAQAAVTRLAGTGTTRPGPPA